MEVLIKNLYNRDGGMAHLVKCPSCKCEALCSYPSTTWICWEKLPLHSSFRSGSYKICEECKVLTSPLTPFLGSCFKVSNLDHLCLSRQRAGVLLLTIKVLIPWIQNSPPTMQSIPCTSICHSLFASPVRPGQYWKWGSSTVTMFFLFDPGSSYLLALSITQ